MILIKCIHCNHDISSNNNYCSNCGQTVPSLNKKIKNIFSISSFLKKISYSHIITLVIIGSLLIGFIICYFLTGIPIKEESLKDYLVGQSISVNEIDYTINEENIVSFLVNSRDSIRNRTDKISGILTLDLQNSTAIYDVTFNLKFNSSTNSWEFESYNDYSIEKIEPKVELKDNLDTLLQHAEINYNDNILKLNEGFLKEISNVHITGDGIQKSVNANLHLVNNIFESKVNVTFNAYFNLDSGQWELDSKPLEVRIIEKDKLINDLSDYDKKNFVLSAFKSSESYSYNYDLDPYIKSITFGKNNISNIDIINFIEYKDNTIRAEVKGQAANGPVNKIIFSGVVYLKLSLINTGVIKKDINIDSIELTTPNLNQIKNDSLEHKINNKPITLETSSTIIINSEIYNQNPFNKLYNGEITLEDKKINISIDYSLNYSNNSYEWSLNKITKN